MSTLETPAQAEGERLDGVLMAIIANRFNAVVREMTSTLLRAGRSAVLTIARDFSCSIVTSEDELLAATEGIPVHVFGAHLQSAQLNRVYAGDIHDGDAFLDNDPYTGNTHHADHTILVPVFHEGEHVFTAVAKAHMADLGNSQPTQYMPFAKDIYEEGALNFPCIRIQQERQDVAEIIRMCRRRIRVPDQWYGDYLATLGAARTGERRIKEILDKYGVPLIRQFVGEWFDYSERMAADSIKTVPAGEYVRHGQHDRFGPYDPIKIKSVIKVDPKAERIEVDLTENPDCVEAGLNLSEATTTACALTGVLHNLDPAIPKNSGAFRRIKVKLRENCVTGIPQHPRSCSVATTNVADRLVNITGAAFEQAGEEWGIAEGGLGMNIGYGVISGVDFRTDEPYVNQLCIGNNGGPATFENDGWLTYTLPVVSGHMYRDSVEIDEQKYPVEFHSTKLVVDSGGAGRTRGGAGIEIIVGARGKPMRIIWSGDCHETRPKGVHDGLEGGGPRTAIREADGTERELEPLGEHVVEPGTFIIGRECGGGGFGDPVDREPERVLADVREKWISPEAAREIYRVALAYDEESGRTVLDEEGTRQLRAEE
ncbi:MAG: hydantoinase B/oxoprolinase family protein [Actinobacteria bacterium]|nr:hydantoinase B/oxoprolinase family protein [Actinomycetota bacterium]